MTPDIWFFKMYQIRLPTQKKIKVYGNMKMSNSTLCLLFLSLIILVIVVTNCENIQFFKCLFT